MVGNTNENGEEQSKPLDKARLLDFFGGKEVELPEGYVLKPLSALGVMHLEEEFDISFEDLQTLMTGLQDKPRLGQLMKILWCWLRQDYPKLTLAELANAFEISDVGNIAGKFQIILGMMMPNIDMETVPSDFPDGQEEAKEKTTISTGQESSTPSPSNTDGQQT